MPKGIIYALMVIAILAMIPPAMIARTRTVQSPARRIHINLDMDLQGKLLQQDPSKLFADGRAMRPPVENTLSREDFTIQADDHFYRGVVTGADGQPSWATTYPSKVAVDLKLLERGRERFNIYCLPCHGVSGYGDGIVHQRAQLLMVSGQGGTTWVQPKSVHDPLVREQSVGQIYNTITNGVRNMAGYASQIPPADRWAITAYLKALQLSQHASIEDVKPEDRENMLTIPLPPHLRPQG